MQSVGAWRDEGGLSKLKLSHQATNYSELATMASHRLLIIIGFLQIVRHLRGVYEKVYNVSVKQLMGSCIKLSFGHPYAASIQLSRSILCHFPTCYSALQLWILNGILEANSDCLYSDDHRSMLQVFGCCRKSRTAPHVERNGRQLRPLHHILFCFLHI